MMRKKLFLTGITLCLALLGCKESKKVESPPSINNSVKIQQEKIEILETLNNETAAAFQRNYDAWKNNWVQDEDITKIYINFPDSSFSESVGWEEISQFVKTFIETHPEPEPVPELLNEIDVRLYGSGAWVTYEQLDSLRGLKRETRLMEKVNGRWKIAGMQTTIYGFKTGEEN